jgi:uncharacterized protein YaaR (DUF327 family)
VAGKKETGVVWRNAATSDNHDRDKLMSKTIAPYRKVVREELLICLKQMLTALKKEDSAALDGNHFFLAVINVLEDKVNYFICKFFFDSINLFPDRP